VAGFQNFGQQAAKTMGVFLMKQVRARLGPNPETSCLFGTLLSIIRTLIAIIRTPHCRQSVPFFRLSVPVLRLSDPFLGLGGLQFGIQSSENDPTLCNFDHLDTLIIIGHLALPLIAVTSPSCACSRLLPLVVSKSIGKIRRWH
jgi:hypothetical protein